MSILLPPKTEQELAEMTLVSTVTAGKAAADVIMEKFKKSNLVRFTQQGLTQEQMIMKSLWVHHRLRAVPITMGGVSFVIDLLNLCISGDIETALVVVSLMQPDDMSEPYHFLSAEVLAELAQTVQGNMP